MRSAAAIGYPVVLKVVSDEIPHRSEYGLVAVGLKNADEVLQAYADHDSRIAKLGLEPATVQRVVQPLAPSGVEVIIGIGSDPEFGHFVAFGAGGVLVELIGDAVVRPLPLRRGEALAMVRASKAFRLLSGFRGAPACDIDALVDCIERIAAFTYAHGDQIREIDLNPVFVAARGKGCVIADALIVPAPRK